MPWSRHANSKEKNKRLTSVLRSEKVSETKTKTLAHTYHMTKSGLPGKWSGSSKVGFVSTRLLESFHMTNISKWFIFLKTVQSEIKNDVKKWYFSRWFDRLDTGSKEEEYGKFVFLFNRKLSCLVINDDHLFSSYSLNKIILDHSPVFFGLVEAGNWQPGSGLLPM